MSHSSDIQNEYYVVQHWEQKSKQDQISAPLIHIGGRVKYNHIELESDEDLKVVWKSYHHMLK